MKNIESSLPSIKPHAIIVEDNYDLAFMYRYALKQAGYFVKMISNGREALHHLESVSPRLLLLDLRLPEVDGDSILDSILKFPAYADTKIFLISNGANLSQLYSDKVDLVLKKPVTVKKLTQLALQYHPDHQRKPLSASQDDKEGENLSEKETNFFSANVINRLRNYFQ